ncbi:(E3-independent) E2 ubiquitin-conjugating enzyme UBE2O isoform X1 [Drosophila pseudoobscura]|uniref:(E3-independent) E2 ubiquitin-conjugating enzyme UBE2O isoform X1 n=2 Tax=Drosophila pseudoobscura pseudoobscura TaxID=46245 RepID=A0A6I8V336_DROPS|nr:(E3-independent) E2 ubiquitin-conjugating enzyme UBE2O isoform X1 [Drosophila pseudoobscura]
MSIIGNNMSNRVAGADKNVGTLPKNLADLASGAPSSNRMTGGGIAASKSAENSPCRFFFEDEIFRIDSRGRVHFGVVTETTESHSSEDEDDNDPLFAGEVRVAFYPDGKEQIRMESAIGLADRTLMPGDVVRRRLPGQRVLTGPSGYVRDVNVSADVKVLGSKFVIKNVPAERLRPISQWARDIPVCFDTWVGTTINVDEVTVLRTASGGRLEIGSAYFHKFRDANSKYLPEIFTPHVLFPGNVVVGRLPPFDRFINLTPDIPLPLNRKRALYTVESIQTLGVDVAWTCRATTNDCNGDPLKQPKTHVTGEELVQMKRLNIYESYMLQIHDRFFLKYTKNDPLVNKQDWEEELTAKYRLIYENQGIVDTKRSKPKGSNSGGARNTSKFRRNLNKSGNSRSRNGDTEGAAKVREPGSGSSTKVSSDDTYDLIEDVDGDEDFLDVTMDSEGQEELAVGLQPEASDKKNEAPVDAATNTSGGGAATNNQQRITVRIGNRRYGKKKKITKKTLSSPFVKKHIDPRDGDEIVVETLVVRSTATIVWQDGTVEENIPSTHLYPIHHLDNHEFFPGDFVSKANENSLSQTEYGVIQSVDHDERISKVKWFNIYTKKDTVPICREVEELSVYDLKDHADYQYRPGTMVIRVANFTNENAKSTAGQVVDNFPDGRVRVWWAMGHITMCYPQDLFEINQNDHDHDGYLSDGSDNSWETQSEDSLHGQLTEKEHILTGIDSVSDALGKLEKIHHLLPDAEKSEVHIDLVAIYTNCHYLDRLLKSSFFGPEHLGRALDSNRISKTYRAIQNIINVDPDLDLATTPLRLHVAGPPVSPTSTSTPTKRKSSTEIDEVQCKRTGDIVTEEEEEEVTASNEDENSENAKLIAKYRCEYNHLIEVARNSILVAFDIRTKAKNDSGVHSRGENSMSELTNSASDRDPVEPRNQPSPELKPQVVIDFSDTCGTETIEMFAMLIKEQLSKCRILVEDKIQRARRAAQEAKDTDEDEHSYPGTYDVDPEDVCIDLNEVVLPPQPVAEMDVEQKLEKCDDAMEHTLDLNALSESLPPIDRPMASSSPSPTPKIVSPSRHSPVCENCFEVVPNAPLSHRFIRNPVTPANKSQYQRSIQREYSLLQLSLPPGVIVRAYEDRMDLMSVMMVGPKRTPYQNALFFFDFQMGRDYPRGPPICHYTSYCTERLNPNLYEEGKVCVSLLGTWAGRDTEMWSITSTMLQVLVSIQGLILVDEPYYNEAGYEKQRGTQLGLENSRVYNEMAIIKIAHSTVKQLQNPPPIFRNELIQHFKEFGTELYDRIQAWADYSSEAQRLRITNIKEMPADYKAPCEVPEFPLLPCSRGFCVAVKGVLAQLKPALDALGPMLNAPETALNAPDAGLDAVEPALEAIDVLNTEWMAIETGKAPRAAPEEV